MVKKISFNKISKTSFLNVPLLLGILLIFLDISFEFIKTSKHLEKEIQTYEENVRAEIKEDVEVAIYISDHYYQEHKDYKTTEEIKEDLTILLGNLKNSDGKYFFGADENGVSVLGPVIGKNMYEVEDKNGLKVVQELLVLSQNGGGYLEYVMPDIEGVKQEPKISYVEPFEPFGWYIGAGIYLSEIETMHSTYRQDFLFNIFQTVCYMGMLILLFIIILSRIYGSFYRKIKIEVNQIRDFLDKSEDEHAILKTEEFRYLELEQIGEHTSELIQKLKVSEMRFKSIVLALPDVIFILNSKGDFLDCEVGEKTWLITDKENFIGKNIKDVLPPEIAKNSIELINKALETEEIQIYEYDLKEGNDISYFEVRIISTQNQQVFAVLRDVTEIKKAQRNFKYLSFHDQLTDLFNRRYFEETIMEMDTSENLPISLAMIDVNGLKLTNDAFGHQTGDKLLCTVANILKESCKKTDDFVARIGGDEFVIVMPKTSLSEMENIISEIHNNISQLENQNSVISISIGGATKTEESQEMSDVYKSAEHLMYSRKLVESQSMRNQTVQAIMKTLNEKNLREKNHSERVSKISRMIGEKLQLDHVSINEIETAGLLHDIGKIAIDEEILNKPGKLNVEEYNEIKRHPESSYQILKTIDAYAGLAEDVLSHHERWDGKGYPRGLKAEEISINARIITIADAYEAMTANRPYREAQSKEVAILELEKYAGKQFDPEIVKVFVEKVAPELE